MKKPLDSFGVLCLAVVLLSAGVGCEAQDCDVTVENPDGSQETREGVCLKSTKLFRAANPEIREAAWLPGSAISIESVLGDVSVVQGSGSNVRATFDKFISRAYDTPESEIIENLKALNTDVTGDANGAVLVKSSRTSGPDSRLGADITVEIPPTFDGALSLALRSGTTDIDFAGNANRISVDTDVGSCEVTASPVAAGLLLKCDNGDITANIPGVPPGTEPRTIVAAFSDVALSFASVPAGTKYTVTAFAENRGTVTITGAETAGCVIQSVGEGSKTVLCNGATQADPIYNVTAPQLAATISLDF